MSKICRMFSVLAAVTALFASLATADSISGSSGFGKDLVRSSRTYRLQATLQSLQPSYKVNEAIRLTAQVNKKSYLYLFTVKKDGTAMLLFPNAVDGNNYLYPDKPIAIPEKSRIVFDAPGNEKIYMVASSAPLQLSDQKGGQGDFTLYERDVFQSVHKDITLEPGRVNGEERATFDLEIPVLADTIQQPVLSSRSEETEAPRYADQSVAVQQPAPHTPPIIRNTETLVTKPLVLVGTDKLSYRNGDPVTVSVASDTEGILELFVLDDSKEPQSFGEIAVRKDRIYKKRAVAMPPLGRQYLIAVYKPKSSLQPQMSVQPSKNLYRDFAKLVVKPANSAMKGLVLEPEKPAEPEAYAVYQFEVR